MDGALREEVYAAAADRGVVGVRRVSRQTPAGGSERSALDSIWSGELDAFLQERFCSVLEDPHTGRKVTPTWWDQRV